MTLLPRTDRDHGQTQNRFDRVGQALRFRCQAAFVSIRAVESAQPAQLRQAASQVYVNVAGKQHPAAYLAQLQGRDTLVTST